MAEVEDGLGPAQDGVAQDGLGPPPDGLGPTPDGLGPTDGAAPQESTKKDAETLKKQAAKKSKEKWGKPGSDPAMPSDAKKGDLKYPTAAASVALGEAEIKRIAKEKGTDFSTAARHFNDVIKLELRPPAAQVTEPVEREAMATPETLEPGSQAEPQPEPQLEEGAGEQQFEGGVDEHGTDVGGEAAPPAADKKSVTAAKKKAKKTCNQKIKNPEGKGPKVFKFPDANNEWVQGEAAMKASDYAKAQQHFEQAFALSQEGAVAAADGEQWEDGQWEDGQWEGEQWEDEQYDDQQQWDDQEQWDDQQQYDDDQQQWDGQQQDDEAQWDEQQQDGAGGDEGQYQNEDQWAEAPPPGWEQQQQEAGGAVDELTPEEAEDLRYQGHEEVTFHEEGSLGLGLVKQKSLVDDQDYFVVRTITPGSVAEGKPDLRTGQILHTVQGETVENLTLPQLTEQLKTRPVTLTFKYHVSTKKIEGGVMVASGMNRWMNRAKASGGGDKSEAGALGSGLGGEADAADAASAEVTVKFYDQKIGLVMGEYQHLDGHKYMSVEGKRAGSEAEGKHEVKIGMLLKEVAGQTMAGRAMHEITEILARSERPLSITLMDMERQRGGGGEAVGKVSAELVQCRAKLKAVEEDGARVLEHMYHMEDQLATAQAENDRLQQEVTQHKESLRLLDQSQAELQAMYDGVNSELHMERRKGERITDENLQIRDRLARLADQYERVRGQLSSLQGSMESRIAQEQEAHARTQTKLDFANGELDHAIRDQGHARAEADYARAQASVRVSSSRSFHNHDPASSSWRPSGNGGGGGGGGAVGAAAPPTPSPTRGGLAPYMTARERAVAVGASTSHSYYDRSRGGSTRLDV